MKPKDDHKPVQQIPWLILFDGVCGWCTGWVRFLIKIDSHKRFQFAPLQSPLGKHLLNTHKLSHKNISTFVVVTSDGFFTKSTAALLIAHRLGGLWRFFYAFSFVPKFLRDGIYDLMARYRYLLRGTLTTCYQPPKEYQDRFVYDV